MKTEEYILAIVFIMIGSGLGVLIGMDYGRNQVRQEAINVSVAEYTVNKQSGRTTFVWIKPLEVKAEK